MIECSEICSQHHCQLKGLPIAQIARTGSSCAASSEAVRLGGVCGASKCSCDCVAIYRARTQSRRRRWTNLAAIVAASTSRSSGASKKTEPDGPQIAFLMFDGTVIGCHVL